MEKKSFKIAMFAGDGSETEVMREALKILRLISEKSNVNNLVLSE